MNGLTRVHSPHHVTTQAVFQSHSCVAVITAGAAQVGIEECLHIEFEYDKARYHLKVGI